MGNTHVAASERIGDAVVVRLDNGMRVVVCEDHRSPVAVCNVWVRVGSNREPDGVRGWAHGIEHMLFKGTARRGEGAFAREVADLGGTTNAGTGYETTNYHVTVPAEHIGAAIDILADALFHAAFTPSAMDAERPVLVHENHMYDDQPAGFGVTWRWALSSARDVSPYRHPIGGVDVDLLETPRERILDFWRAAYQPDNMTAVVVGDVDAAEVVAKLAAACGGERPPRPYALPEPAVEPRHDALRYRIERGELQRVYGKLVLPGLAESDPDRAAYAVVQQILSDGRSARLYRRVQEERKLVGGIGLLAESGPREGVLMIDFETDAARATAALAAAAEVLAELREEPVEAAELARAKIRLERSHAMDRETVQGRAADLGWHDAMGDIREAWRWPARVAAVTPDDVRRVCRRLFVREETSVLLYAPRGEGGEGLPQDADTVEALLAPVLDGPRGAPPAAAAAADRRADPAPTSAAGAGDEPFVARTLRGGLRLFVRRNGALPIVSLAMFATGGVCRQPRGKDGLAHLAQRVQAKATATEDAAALHAFIEGCGASLTPLVSRDSTGLALTGLGQRLEPLLERLGLLACAPAFPTDEIEQERRLAAEELDSQRDDPFQAAARKLRGLLYPGHPYGAPLIGTEASLPLLNREDLLAHHARAWTAPNVAIVVSGDVDVDRLAKRLDDVLADLPTATPPPLPDLTAVPTPAGVVRTRETRDVKQSVVLCGWRGPADPNTDRAALALLQSLVNGQSGRLFEALRNRRSLCYASGVQILRGLAPGMCVGYVLTDPATEDEACAALVAELHEVATDPAGAEEFARARARLLGNLLISRQSNDARVGRAASDVLYGRDPNGLAGHLEEIRALTPERVRDAAAAMLGGDDRWEVVVGPARG